MRQRSHRYKDLKLTFTFSCYLIKHGDDYMVWDSGFAPGSVVVLRMPGHTPGG